MTSIIFCITSNGLCLPTALGVIIGISAPASMNRFSVSLQLDMEPTKATSFTNSAVNTSAGFSPS